MKPSTKTILAKEWLIFVGILVVTIMAFGGMSAYNGILNIEWNLADAKWEKLITKDQTNPVVVNRPSLKEYKYKNRVYYVNGDPTDFLKKHPNANRIIAYVEGGDIYEIPTSKKDAFLRDLPDATELNISKALAVKSYQQHQKQQIKIITEEENALVDGHLSTVFKLNICKYIFWGLFIILYVFRYLFFSIRWSFHTILQHDKDSHQNSPPAEERSA